MSEEEKQDYLRENIIEQNYSGEEFIAFFASKCNDESFNLENYSLEYLIQIVEEFKKANPRKEKAEEAPAESNPSQSTIDLVNTANAQLSSIVISDKDENFEEVYQGKKIEISELALKELKITVTKPEKKYGGIYTSTYITYLVSTEPLEFEVRRRYSDFEWLRKMFITHFPAFWIPPIPLKNYSDRFESEFIDKRMRYLEKFLYSIARNPTLSVTPFFMDFISIKSESEFNDKKKKYNSLKAPTKLNEMSSVDGSVSL